ncbi:hypothetical protein Dsin_021573 [Dipteronia sinensis]|uniref:Calmodulin binding protein-like N-terminal domain-containing protein n=1 Tax=Dipteronia sinensis TaxID=43782 RepID=A0AAE0DYY3_9ROSI|nr:hypothetical protein Dsin_021573 [Dipteronia sinensis]
MMILILRKTENWTEMEFNAKIVHQRGDRPLVKGNQNIMLKNGVGTIQDLSVSDNSSWLKCKKFRLGARVVQSSSNMGQVRIKEAITEAFAVKDYPVKSCSKWEWDAIVQHADDGIISQEAEAYNSATTGPRHPQFQSIHQGMHNYSNRASSSSPYESAYPPEIVQQYFTPRPPPSHVNTQLTLGNDNHQPLNKVTRYGINLK